MASGNGGCLYGPGGAVGNRPGGLQGGSQQGAGASLGERYQTGRAGGGRRWPIQLNRLARAHANRLGKGRGGRSTRGGLRRRALRLLDLYLRELKPLCIGVGRGLGRSRCGGRGSRRRIGWRGIGGWSRDDRRRRHRARNQTCGNRPLGSGRGGRGLRRCRCRWGRSLQGKCHRFRATTART